MDTVTVTVVITYEYYRYHTTDTFVYRYDQTTDTWDIYDYPDWRNDIRREYIASAFLGTWEGKFNGRGSYSLTIDHVDFETCEISGTFIGNFKVWSVNGYEDVILDTSGTYAIKEDHKEYHLEIPQGNYIFVFKLFSNGIGTYIVTDVRTGSNVM